MTGICFFCDVTFNDGEDGRMLEGYEKVGICDECHTRAIEIGAEEWNGGSDNNA